MITPLPRFVPEGTRTLGYVYLPVKLGGGRGTHTLLGYVYWGGYTYPGSSVVRFRDSVKFEHVYLFNGQR